MKELNKLFSDIEFQYQDESMKYRRLNTVLKFVKSLLYH